MAVLDQILGPLEIALNRALGLSPAALEKLAHAQGAIAVEFRDLGWAFSIFPAAHGVQLIPGVDDPRAGISTSLVGMARLMAGENPREMGRALELQGDAEYAEMLMLAMREARIDLESEISSLLGPVLGSGLGQGLKNIFELGRGSVKSLLLGGLAPATAGENTAASADSALADGQAVRDWMDAVDDTATALDRVEARIARLEQRRGEA